MSVGSQIQLTVKTASRPPPLPPAPSRGRGGGALAGRDAPVVDLRELVGVPGPPRPREPWRLCLDELARIMGT